jgi:hypothetical protein
MEEIFVEVRRRYQLAEGDFPKLQEYKAQLSLSDFSTFPAIDRKVLTTLQDLLLKDVPKITALVAGVGIAPKKKKKEDEHDDRQPQMFQMMEGGGNGGMWVAISLVVLLVAIAIASFLDNHQMLLRLLAAVQSALQQGVQNVESVVAGNTNSASPGST